MHADGARLNYFLISLSLGFQSSGSGNKKPYIFSPFGWGLDGGSKRIYRAQFLVLCILYTLLVEMSSKNLDFSEKYSTSD